MITVAEALAVLRETCAPGPVEKVPLREGLGRVLARDVEADLDWPPFDTSAMDGYAVRVSDASPQGAVLAERPGLVGAGARPPAPLTPGEAVRVMTGSPLPEGTEAIVPVENVRRDPGGVAVLASPRAGEHIRRRGESVSAGAVLVARGRRLLPADVALAALAGAEPLSVHRRPRVTVAVTGNELVPASEKPGPGQLRDSNGPMLLALCQSRDCPAVAKPAVADEDAAVRGLFEKAGREEDVLITSGGVSAGDLDLLPGRAESAGFEILFHGVAMRPGKPVAFGRRGHTLWFGLPGNPVSTAVCFHLFVRFALDALEGAEAPGAVFVSARLQRGISTRGRRETYRDALISVSDGENRVTPLESRGSHDLASHARSNALIRLPPDAQAAAGTLVDCLVF